MICPECQHHYDELSWCMEDEEFVGDVKFCSRECSQKAYFRKKTRYFRDGHFIVEKMQ